MATPQSGILPDGNSHALFLTLRLELATAAAVRQIRAACGGFPALTETVASIDPASNLVSVLGIGPAAWKQLMPKASPALLRPFRARADGPRRAPATAADLLLHIRGERRDLSFELARQMRHLLGLRAAIIEEVSGFRYLDNRDFTGFVDGTENPQGEDRATVALVGAEDASFTGGSYVHMQRYVHDLARWERLAVSQQEITIGRTKPNDVELPSGVKPPFAHISRVTIEENGEALEILRHNMPYGGTDRSGLVFIAYSRSPEIFDQMLDRMIYADADGEYDHLMDYTQAATGCHFFAPSREILDALAAQSAG
jgi:porphyrinogen peroxidase